MSDMLITENNDGLVSRKIDSEMIMQSNPEAVEASKIESISVQNHPAQ